MSIEWPQGQGLSWSGKWHIISGEVRTGSYMKGRAACGVWVYTQHSVPTDYRRLGDIVAGLKEAPVCKKCTRIMGRT